MDTSEQYIKMCNCPEIQGKKVAIRDKDNFVYIEIKKRAYYIWLPRQDHIQDMMGKDYKNTLDMLCDFYAVITVDQPTGFQKMFEISMEQLWLVFYMFKKHRKKWDGKKWTK